MRFFSLSLDPIAVFKSLCGSTSVLLDSGEQRSLGEVKVFPSRRDFAQTLCFQEIPPREARDTDPGVVVLFTFQTQVFLEREMNGPH